MNYRLLYISLVITLLISCNRKRNETNQVKDITRSGIGGLTLYSNIDDHIKLNRLQSILKKDKNTYAVIDRNDTLLFVSRHSENKIFEIRTESSKMTLGNGIKVGDSVKSVSKFYPEIRKAFYTVKIDDLDFNLFDGSYIIKDSTTRDNDNITLRGIRLNFKKVNTENEIDTVISSIEVTSNIYN